MDSRRTVNGITAVSQNEYDAFLRDEEKIKRIESSFNLKDKKDINKIYSSIVTGTLRFESKVGFDFEDKIEELYKSRNLSAKDEKKKREKYEIQDLLPNEESDTN